MKVTGTIAPKGADRPTSAKETRPENAVLEAALSTSDAGLSVAPIAEKVACAYIVTPEMAMPHVELLSAKSTWALTLRHIETTGPPATRALLAMAAPPPFERPAGKYAGGGIVFHASVTRSYVVGMRRSGRAL